MNKSFNGQINISRDLRKNKQVVIGKYDIIDIIFLLLGFLVAIIVSYLLGFSQLKIMDEFSGILISIFPMLLIISLGFKRTAGIRQFNYIRMKYIDKKSRIRFNRNIVRSKEGEKYILGLIIDNKQVNKYINKFLQYSNLSLLSVRYVKDVKTNKNKIYFILDLRYKRNENILMDLMDKFSFNKELEGISYEEMINLQKDLDLRIENKSGKKEILKDKNYKIYMLNLYDINKYKKIINILKRYSEIVCYFYKDNNTKYVNTFLLIEEEQKKGNKMTKIERIEKLCDEYAVIIDRLTNEQITAKIAISYNMINPFNNYRIYK